MGLMIRNSGPHFILLFSFLLLKCSSVAKPPDKLNYNAEVIKRILEQNGDNIAVLSCLRCGCFVEVYNNRFKEKGSLPKGYVLLADTLCNKFLFPIKFLPSNEIEKISDEIYNLTLIKKKDGIITTKILQVEDSKNLEAVISKFFKN